MRLVLPRSNSLQSTVYITFAICLAAVKALGGVTSWQVSSGTWTTSVNWNNGVPVAGTDAYIDNAGTATITSGTAACNTLNIGTGFGGWGTVQLLSGGSLVVSEQEIIGNSGNGTFTQSGGTNMLGSLGQLHFGASAGSVYILNGGLLAPGSGGIIADAGGRQVEKGAPCRDCVVGWHAPATTFSRQQYCMVLTSCRITERLRPALRSETRSFQ
jgi:hypothetical protein